MASSTSFIQTAPNLLRQPFTIAALASVGIHGLVAANFEKISLFPRTAQLPPSVQLMELSPQQISRLYPPPPQKLTLGTIAAPPSLSTLGPSPTLPEFPATLSTPSFPTFPTSQTLPPISSSRLPDIPSSPGISSFPPADIPSFPSAIPIPDDSNTFPVFPTEPQFKDKNSQELDRLRDRRLAFENLSPEDRAMLENMTPDVYGADIFKTQSPGGEAEENYGIPPQRYVNNLDPETQETTPEETTPVDPENYRGSIYAQLQQSNQSQTESNSELPVTPSSEDTTQRTAMLTGGSAFVAWASQVTQDYPNLQTREPETISSLYPVEACSQQLEGQATVGVAVGPGGAVLDGPTLLSGTGYRVLDDAALAKVEELAVTQLGAEAGNQPTAFLYGFDFNPENCGTPQPMNETTPPPAVPETQPETQPVPVQPSQPLEETPAETQPPVDVNPVNEPEAPETVPQEMAPPEPEPEAESEPPAIPSEPELDDSTPATPPEPQLESNSPPAPVETEEESNPSNNSEEIPPSTPTEHKGSLYESLTTPYTEP